MKGISKHISITIFFVFCLASISIAQIEQYNYHLSIPKSLKEVIHDLRTNFETEFSYPSQLIEGHTIGPARYKSNNLNQLISAILIDTEIDFQVINNKVLLRPKRFQKAQLKNTITISGTIENQHGDPLSFVDVILDTLFIGASSNDKGYFEFEIPTDLKNRSISFHLVGHHSKVKSVNQHLSNPTTALAESITNIQEILLVEKVKSVDIEPTTLRTKSQADYLNKIISAPIVSSDIQRSLQMSAGIDATDDLDASIRIRGSQGDETLIILDGIPIYKAEHFYGIFGSVNGNHINTVSVHKNKLPIEFGGKTGGLVEMNSKEYFNKFSAGADLNMLTTSLTLSGKLNNKWSFITSWRTTHDNAADSKIFNWIEPSPEENIINGQLEDRPLILNTFPVVNFYDLNGKILFRPNENNLFSLSVFQSHDDFNNAYDITFSNPLTIGTIEGQEEMNDQEEWQNFGTAIGHSGNFKNDWKINNRLYHSFFDYSGSLNTSLRLERNNNEFFSALTNQKNNSINDWGFHSVASKEFKNNQFSFGVSGIHHDVGFGFQADDFRSFDLQKSGWEGAMFSSYKWSSLENLSISFGGRLDYYSVTDAFYFAPRMSSTYSLSDFVTLKASYAQHYQFLREVTFYTRVREPLSFFLLTSDGKNNNTYPIGSSTISMLGFTAAKENWFFDVELYNKDLDGVVEHTEVVVGRNPDDLKAPRREIRPVTGTGRTYGVDFSLGHEQKNFSSILAYTWSKSTSQFQEIFQNEPIPAENDRRHQLKLINQLELGKWSLTGNYIFASGRNQLNLFDQEEVLNLAEVIGDNTFTRLDPYHRLDLGLSYGFEVAGSKASIGLSVFNLTNNKNVDYIQYLFAIPTRRQDTNRNILTGTTTQLLDRTFNLNFKFDW